MAKNREKASLSARKVLGKKVLIRGESGAGKTRLAAELLQELMLQVSPEEITVIDLAPKRTGGIGGKITDHVNVAGSVKYLSSKEVYTPRLAGTSAEQVLSYAEKNRRIMEPLLHEFVHDVTEVLVLNDVTLYLHLGDLKNVLKCAGLAKTFIATAYYGSKLVDDLGTGITARERQLTERLADFMDIIVESV